LISTVPRGYGGLAPEFSYAGGLSFNGTSFAAPHVTGIAALVAAKEPGLTPEQIKTRIIETAEPILPLAGKVKASGRANAYNAVANRIAAVPPLGATEVIFTKKIIYINGLGFMAGSMLVEVNGVPVTKVRYDDLFALRNGSLTQINVKMGKQPIAEAFPLNTPVNLTLTNQATGERFTLAGVVRR
jgi:hypothetical protein